jgi:hypothetical protein
LSGADGATAHTRLVAQGTRELAQRFA